MLSQLVYVSSRKSTCTDTDIEKILSACKKNNPTSDTTGVLLYSQNKFIQYLEGDSKQLLNLYDKIKQDKRHEKVMMISYGPIKEKNFPSWHMATKQVTGEEIDFRTDITQNDRKVFKYILQGEVQEGAKVLSLLKKFFN
jgi:hypothetical protein